jgi:Transcriptional regulatory protein, C terminal
MPSDLLAAARVFQIPGPAASPEPGAGAAQRSPGDPEPVMRPVGSVLPEGTLRSEGTLHSEVSLPADLDSLTGPDGPSSPGTLLAVVPIPGTNSSLAIVGYTIPASVPRDRAQVPRRADRGLVVDHARRCVWLGGREVQLTYQEFELLAFLSANPAQVFSRADLLERVWGQRENSHHQTRTVDVHVSRLRRKLGPGFGQCLTTEHRVGYRFDPAMEISA